MDGPVVGAIITASVALVVAVGGAIRSTVRTAADRRYERRRSFLIDAQDAMLVVREALDAYGFALRDQLATDAGADTRIAQRQSGASAVLMPNEPSVAASFVMAVPNAVSLQVKTARGRLAAARSRLEDESVAAALDRWESLAQASLIDPQDTQASAEESAFDQVNDLMQSALRSARGKVRRHEQRRLRSRPDA